MNERGFFFYPCGYAGKPRETPDSIAVRRVGVGEIPMGNRYKKSVLGHARSGEEGGGLTY